MSMFHVGSKTPEEMQMENLVQGRHNLEQEIKNYNYRAIQNTIFAIGTGTFVLSISFIGYINTPLQLEWFLIASWVLLAGSITSKIYSNYLGIYITGYAQGRLEEYVLSDYKPVGFNINNYSDSPHIMKLVRRRDLMDYMTLSLIFIGMATLIIFASVNLLAQNEIRNKNAHTTLSEQETTQISTTTPVL